MARADVFYVDDNGGPGVDFTDLPPAVAAAAPGDVIFVFSGTYAATTVNEGITIQAVAGGTRPIVPSLLVENLPPKQLAVVVDLEIRGVWVRSCAGTVVLEGIDASTFTDDLAQPLRVELSDDVRAYRSYFARGGFALTPLPAAVATSCRFEFVGSGFAGQFGMEDDCHSAQDGTAALVLQTGVRANGAATTWLRGGDGGDQWDDCVHCGFQLTGNGGPGIIVGNSSHLILTGAAEHIVAGGDAGSNLYYGWYCDCTGTAGPGIRSNSGAQVTWAGVSFAPGLQECTGRAPDIEGPAIQLPTISYLTLQPPANPGGPYRFVVWGEPGSTVELVIGKLPIVEPTFGVDIERLVQEDRRVSMGTISPSGNVSTLVPVQFHAPTRHYFFAQAEVTVSGALERTNSQFVYVR